MKKTTKKLLSLLLALVMVMGLAACGGEGGEASNPPEDSQTPASQSPASQSPEGSPAPAPADEEVTLKWAVWDVNLTTY